MPQENAKSGTVSVMPKRFLGVDVLSAARQRISTIFDGFDHVCVSFSGGKDSTAMLHLVMDEAVQRKRRVGLLFIDWEAQYQLTIDHVSSCFAKYVDSIDPYWVALPLLTTNACSAIEPEWTCWEAAKRSVWVREPPAIAITDERAFPFYQRAMTFEEFIPAFGRWYGKGERSASFVGIRTAESLNRWRTLAADKGTYRGFQWTTSCGGDGYTAYPIYDWAAEDVWTYFAKSGREYNRVYDLMFKAGLSLPQMRICEPYGDEQRRGLWLFHVLEPETWGKVAARVAGANSAALYAKERGNILGNHEISKPEGHTWQSYTKFLLDTMPPKTAGHYLDKFSVWRRWYEERGQEIVDELPGDMGSEDMPSWRRLCKVILKHDYWCRYLCFSPTKAHAHERYRVMMARRREKWGMVW